MFVVRARSRAPEAERRGLPEAPARRPHGRRRGRHAGTASRRPRRSAAPGAVIRVVGRFQVDSRYGAGAHRPRAAAGRRRRVRPGRPHRGAADPVRADGRGPPCARRTRCRSRTCASCSTRCSIRRSESGRLYHEAPAAKYYHQAYRHGLLEHCLSVAQGVSALAATFPGIDRDVAVTGALLHDIGKLEAYAWTGQAHRAHGRRQAARRDPARLLQGAPRDRGIEGFPAAAPRPLLHIILSHHGKLEHGSPVVPCTREATLVHFMDNLGGNLGSFDRIQKSLADGVALVGLRPRHLGLGVLRARRQRARSRLARRSQAGAQSDRDRTSQPQIAGFGSRPLASVPAYPRERHGERHREADPAAVPDLVPHGRAAARLGARDQGRTWRATREMNDEASRAASTRPRGAGVARHRAQGRQARRGLLRGRELLAAARRTSTSRRSSSRTRSWARCAWRCTCSTASSPTPSRCGWRCSSSPGASPRRCDAPEERSVAMAVTADSGGRELSQRLSKVETAIFRRKTILFDYYTIGRDAVEKRKVDPFHLLFRGGQFYLIGHSHERDDVRVFRRLAHPRQGRLLVQGRARLQPPRGLRPAGLRDPHRLAARRSGGPARIWLSDRIDWLALRHFGHAGEVTEDDGGAHLRDRVRRLAPARLLGARPGRAGAHPRARTSWSRRRRAPRLVDRAPHRHAELARRRAGAAPLSEEDDAEDRGEAADPARALRAPGHARGHADRRRPRGPQARGRRSSASASRSPTGAAPGHRRAERRELRRRQLRALRRGPGRHRSRSTPSPTATTSPARPGCCRSRPRRWWRPST